MTETKKIVLTGDRPTGKLHLGHYVGSLKNRVALQDHYDCHFIIADFQVLGDHLEKAGEVERNIREITLDWLSVGMDPNRSTFFVQSHVPQLTDLTMYFSSLVTVARCQRNPTIKSEMYEKVRAQAEQLMLNIEGQEEFTWKALRIHSVLSELSGWYDEKLREIPRTILDGLFKGDSFEKRFTDYCQGNLSGIRDFKGAIAQKFLEEDEELMSYAFLGYPVSQAADILLFKAHLVPVGEDQKAHIEQTREIARDFNRIFCEPKGVPPVFPVPEALIGEVPRLPGLDEKPPLGADGFAIPRKMSKSLGNCIYLSDPADEVEKKVRAAFTDPTRLRKDDPGHPDKCNIFAYYEAFDREAAPLRKSECAEGRIGCVACKKQMAATINRLLDPIRARRAEYEGDANAVSKALKEGTEKARAIGEKTMSDVREAVGYGYKSLLG